MLPLRASSLCLLRMGGWPCLKLYGHCCLCHTALQRCKSLAMLTQPLSAQHQLALTDACNAFAVLAQLSQSLLSLQGLVVAFGPLSCRSPCTLQGQFQASSCSRPQHCIPICCWACRTIFSAQNQQMAVAAKATHFCPPRLPPETAGGTT